MDAFLTLTRQALENYTNKLLLEIHKDFGIPLEELTQRYLKETPCLTPEAPQVPQPKSKIKREVKPKPDANMCQFVTAKGQACKFCAKENQTMCGIHLRKSGNPSSAPTKSDTPCKGLTAKGGPCKFKALPNCDYCGTHQTKLNKTAETPKETPKPLMDLKSRLALLTEEEEPEEPQRPTCELEDLLDPEDADELRQRLKEPNINSKIKSILEVEEDEEETNWEEQMCDSPTSRQRLNELLSADTDDDE